VQQGALQLYAWRVLRSDVLKRSKHLRDGAVRLIVALLPNSFSELQEVLADRKSKLWYEVHFTAFCALDDRCPGLRARDQRNILCLMESYLKTAESHAGFAAWKAGDSLGDELFSTATLDTLYRLARSAHHVEGRVSALHGLEHAAKHLNLRSRRTLGQFIAEVAKSDRSRRVRLYAELALQGSSCGPNLL